LKNKNTQKKPAIGMQTCGRAIFEGGYMEMFNPPSKHLREGIEAEVTRLGVFLNSVVVLEYCLNK
jgi:hypothetical protein